MVKIFNSHEIEVTVTNVDDGYTIEQEITALVAADLVILQFPMYWMSLP